MNTNNGSARQKISVSAVSHRVAKEGFLNKVTIWAEKTKAGAN